MSDYVDETHQRIAEFAEEFLDDDDERDEFVSGLLERRGYTQVAQWGPPEPQPGTRQPVLRPPQPKGGQGGGGGRGGGGQGGGQPQPGRSRQGGYWRQGSK